MDIETIIINRVTIIPGRGLESKCLKLDIGPRSLDLMPWNSWNRCSQNWSMVIASKREREGV